MSYWIYNDTEVRTEPDGDAGFDVEIIHAKYIDKNLIAAAPDLLAACEEVLKVANDPDYDEYFDGARIEVMLEQAIAKAKGGAS